MLLLKLVYHEMMKANQTFYRDPRTSHWPLTGSPLPMAAAIMVYLLFIFKLGPNWMANRKPYNVTLYMRIYNAMQVIINLYVFCECFRLLLIAENFSFICQPYDVTDRNVVFMRLRYAAWTFYISKYLDLFDTIFFVLRKKWNQITFLHVYHHSGMVFGLWAYMTLLYASHVSVTGFVNAFVHVCMYTYYFLTSMEVKLNVLWKKRLTQLQILQFLYLTIHFSLPLIRNSCGLDLFWIWVAFIQNLFILILFSDFYVKAYIIKKKPQSIYEMDTQKIQ